MHEQCEFFEGHMGTDGTAELERAGFEFLVSSGSIRPSYILLRGQIGRLKGGARERRS